MVGPNNCGKSTIIGAFRILVAGLRHARSKSPTMVRDAEGKAVYGYSIPLEGLPVSTANIHTDYVEEVSTVSFRLTGGGVLTLLFPADGGCVLIPEAGNGAIIKSIGDFRRGFSLTLTVVPVLGPIEPEEMVYTEEAVQRGVSTHRASRHFRNYWHHFGDGFDEFSELIKKTWPGMEVERPEFAPGSRQLLMMCKENRIARELHWSGFGFQIWCQLLTHLFRAKVSSMVVIDEPEVYLHPDVQRQLLGILRDLGPDVVLATHSTEIMGEADVSEILLIDKKKRSGERLKDVEGLQGALNAVGSIQNVTLAHLAKTKRLLFVEGLNDYKIIRRFAKKTGFAPISLGNEITPVESGGFTNWERIRGMTWGFESLLKSPLVVAAIFDSDYWCEEEVRAIEESLSVHLFFGWIHRRKEIENYLLVPIVLQRAVDNAIADRVRRGGLAKTSKVSVSEILEAVTSQMRAKLLGQYLAKRQKYMREHGSKSDDSTINQKTIELFDAKWSSLPSRMEIVPGKIVLAEVRSILQDKLGVTVSDAKIIDEFKEEEIPKDLLALLGKIDGYRSSQLGRKAAKTEK